MTSFHPLFTVSLLHSYYSGEACQDFDFVFPAETMRQMKNGKLVYRIREGRLHVLYEAGESGAAFRLADGQTLRIGFRLLNPYFMNFTKQGPYTRELRPLYQNVKKASQLNAPKGVVLAGPLFSHSLANSKRPVTVTLKDAGGQTVQTDFVTADAGGSAISYDLTRWDAGLYSVEEVYAESKKITAYYTDPELQRQGAFGALEVHVKKSFYKTAPDFKIRFDAKEETLRYYVVAQNYTDAEFNQLSVSDVGFTEGGRPEVRFTKVASSAFTSDDISPELLRQESADKLVLFKSQAPVAWREEARAKIQLSKNGEALITHLPQPGVNQPHSDRIIQISKPKG